ncbi:hypothetical protein SAMN04488038_106140 [Solimonas aquatica]|uniref:Nickel-dependent hydrogenase n=1 Tax=Solimonas aquatica TaxID=489703 RepID=A0A1H9FXX6_9GAMM|nr:hypothetical protein [Solimonas aquatica]SEQ42669.1 hypothetical protein SAMN04488038_106140 [Solimonas aquatica]
MTAAQPLLPLAGRLRLRAGVAPERIDARPLFAQALFQGMPADSVPKLAGRLYALCGGAHEMAARLALAAARGETPRRSDAAALRELQQQALSEHLRHLWLDWPRHLLGHHAAPEELRVLAQLRQHGVAGLQEVLPHELYGMPAREWVQRRREHQLDQWLAQAASLPARCLRAVADLAQTLQLTRVPSLEALRSPADLRRIAEAALARADFVLTPEFAGRARETGCSPRLQRIGRPRAGDVHARLLDRLEEIALLLLDEPLLRVRALNLGAGRGMACVDTARGMLIHALTLDGAERVGLYRVIAPTEWNFHPRGAFTAAFARQGAASDRRGGTLLALAYDPCIEFEVQTQKDAA